MNEAATTPTGRPNLSRPGSTVGLVAEIWRYPVKSMMGEELPLSAISDHGVVGDRAYALIDPSDGKVASAKNPRKWPRMFEFGAQFTGAVGDGGVLPPVRISVPDGTEVISDAPEADDALSRAFGRRVTLERAEHADPRRVAAPRAARHRLARAEEYWPDIGGLDHRDTVTDFDLPEGTFFDCAVVHVLTSATLDRLAALYPSGRFEVRRFRPNVVVETSGAIADFAENAWVGRAIQIGDGVILRITEPCPRCVMTTLAQGDLPKDSEILRTLAQHNSVNAGVYASVVQTGTVRSGDAVKLID